MAGIENDDAILPQLPVLSQEPTGTAQGDPHMLTHPATPSHSSDNFQFSGEVLRGYQAELAKPGIKGENYIICAPTGSGKTAVAAYIISDHLRRKYGRGKVIFVVNKVPLAEQQKTEIKRYIRNVKVGDMVGDTNIQLKTLLGSNDVVVCTAGVLVNSLEESHSAARIKLKDISLLIIDECHHTKKNSPHAKIMISYLKKKYSSKQYALPQVIGLTATPGTGDARVGDLMSAVEHMTKLCAHMDANGGIKTVEEASNRRELLQHTQNTPLRMIPVAERSSDTEFFKIVVAVMDRIEKSLNENSPHSKHEQAYENWVVQQINIVKTSDTGCSRQKLIAFEYLRWFSVALTVYADLNEKYALKVIKDHLAPLSLNMSDEFETTLHTYFSRVCKVGQETSIESPLLVELRERISQEFSQKPDYCQGIIFCQTKHNAESLGDWINHDDVLQKAGVRAGVVVGHGQESGMNLAMQRAQIKDFRKLKLNLIVATTVLEEGFDVPACNLVIRLHVTNEIARKQAHGRARAEDSKCFTILTEGSRKELKEMENKEREALAEHAFAYLPSGKELLKEFNSLQLDLLDQWKASKAGQMARTSTCDVKTVRLLCGMCKEFACQATDVAVLNLHYVVPSEEFRTKYKAKQHPKPKSTRGIEKIEKIYCSACDADWGVQCIWTALNNRHLPVLKCTRFIFEIDGTKTTFSQWSKVTFQIASYEKPGGPFVTDDSSSDSD